MTCVASIHGAGGTLAGSGIIVAPDLVLTCAHVVNAAMKRTSDDPARPPADRELEVRFAGAPKAKLSATVDLGPDAWAGPPAKRAEGADLCLLKLRGQLPAGASIGQVQPTRFETEFDVRVSGYPSDWNDRAATPQLDVAVAKVLALDGYLWLLRADAGAWTATIATGKRSAGLIHQGFSGGPVQVGGAVVGMIAEVRKEFSQATAYAIPAHHFPTRILRTSKPADGGWWAYSLLGARQTERLYSVGYFHLIELPNNHAFIRYARVVRINPETGDFVGSRGGWSTHPFLLGADRMQFVCRMDRRQILERTDKDGPAEYRSVVELRKTPTRPVIGEARWEGTFDDLRERKAVSGAMLVEPLSQAVETADDALSIVRRGGLSLIQALSDSAWL
jgi:hypothetical protein